MSSFKLIFAVCLIFIIFSVTLPVGAPDPALAGDCSGLSLSASPPYIYSDALIPGTARFETIKLKRGCAAEDYEVGLTVMPAETERTMILLTI